MPVLVCCDSCTGKYRVPDQHAGKRIKCPKCSNPVTVPAAEPAAKQTVPVVARKPAAETVKNTVPPLPKQKPLPPAKPAPPRPKVPEPEPELEPVSEAAPEDVETPRDNDRPRKKKRRKKRQEPTNTWIWWAGGIGVGLIAAVIAMVLVANSGHKEAVIGYAIGLAIMVPISTVILIISMV